MKARNISMKFNKIVSYLFLFAITVGLTGTPANGYFQNANKAGADAKSDTSIRAKALGKVSPGREFVLSVELESAGKVNVVSFTLNFDPAVFKYVSTSLGADKPASANLGLNVEQTATGKLGVLIDSGFAFEKGKKQMLTAVFLVARDAPQGDYQFFFNSTPAKQGVATTDMHMLNATYETSSVTVAAKRKAIQGRVLDRERAGVWHAKVSLKGADGKEKTYLTGTFGYFVFDDLPDGTYTVSSSSKNHSFTTQTVEVKDTFNEIEFLKST